MNTARNGRYSGKRNGRAQNRDSHNGNGRRFSRQNGNGNGFQRNAKQNHANGKGGSTIPPVILPVDGTEGLEFGVWESGQWGPAFVDDKEIIHRSYHWSDLLEFPQLLLAGAEWYLSSEANDYVNLSSKEEDSLSSFVETLRTAFS